MKALHISDDLSLPIDFVTERIAFLARTGAGKSGGMRVLFEAFLDTKQFAIFVDPKGDAWGIRAAGIEQGYPVLVMGGDHGDVPLEASAGKVIAEFLVRERVSTVLDISDFGKADMVRFVTDLASTLYRRNREVVHVFLDEADMVAGEKFYDPKCLEAIQLIQNKGRHRGFGVTLATQRSAMINKSVLYASGTLIAMQTTAPKDIKVVRDWLEVVATPDVVKEVVSVLPVLKTREALIYSPQYLGGDTVRIAFKSFKTFDSMRTPKPGETRQQPKSLADIDLSVIQRDMAATIEKAKAEDPKEIRKKYEAQIAELKNQLKNNQPDLKTVEKQINAGIQAYVDESRRVQAENAKLFNDLRGRLEKIGQLAHLNGNAPAIAEYKPIQPRVVVDRPAPTPRKQADSNSSIGQSGLRRILVALAQRPQGLSTRQIGVRAGLSSKSGSFNTYMSRARSNGWVVGERGHVQITDEGIAALGDYDPLPTGDALLQHWLSDLGDSGAARILSTLAEAYPQTLSKNQVAERAALSGTSGSFNTYLSRLRSLELIEGRGELKASEELFD